jgi:hypothetical protein
MPAYAALRIRYHNVYTHFSEKKHIRVPISRGGTTGRKMWIHRRARHFRGCVHNMLLTKSLIVLTLLMTMR